MTTNMKNNNDKLNKKGIATIAIAGITACTLFTSGCVWAKNVHDKKVEEARLEAINTKNSEIDKEYKKFDSEEDRNVKLELLKIEYEKFEKYKKSEEYQKECETRYNKIINQMKEYFISDYDNSVKTISDKIGKDVDKVEDKDSLKNAITDFTNFKETLKNDYENYSTITEDKFNEYNDTVDSYVTKYNDRVTAIEKAEEEARKKAEEEAKKKAEEESAKKKAEEEAAAKAAQEEAERKAAEEAAAAAAAAKQSSGSSSNDSSYYDSSNDYSYSGGSSSSDYSDDSRYDSGSSSSGNDYSGGSSSSGGDSNSSGSGSGWSSGNLNHTWAEDGAGRVDGYYDPSNGDIYDANGNYQGNLGDW